MFFSFFNKVAKIVGESCPDCTLMTFAYLIGIHPPVIKLEDNVMLVFAPMGESLGVSLLDPEYKSKAKNFLGITNHTYGEYLTGWSTLSNQILVYNYFGVSRADAYYERPFWYRIQQDLKDYVSLGVVGMIPEGDPDSMNGSNYWGEEYNSSFDRVWELNALGYWLYSKLSWNPDEDVAALIAEFCDKVYGDASEDMKEYYRLLQQGWEEGLSKYDSSLSHEFKPKDYFRMFIFRSGVREDMMNALLSASEKADEIRKGWIDYRIAMLERFLPQ